MGLKIFPPDHPLVLDGSHDEEGYTPRERRAQLRKQNEARRTPMRLFDQDHLECWLDTIAHRVDKDDVKVLDLTLRVEPFTAELATGIDEDFRTLLFSARKPIPKPNIKSMEFIMPIAPQRLLVRVARDVAAGELALNDCAIDKIRAKRPKDKSEYLFTCRASLLRPSARELEFVIKWHTESRFVTFVELQADLAFDRSSAPHHAAH